MRSLSRLLGPLTLSLMAWATVASGCSAKNNHGVGGDASTATNGGPGNTSGGSLTGGLGGAGSSTSSGGPSCDPGSVDMTGCVCDPTSAPRQCFVGDPAKAGKGSCVWGTQACNPIKMNEFMGGEWGPCNGSGMPSPEVCDGKNDEDCDGAIDNGCTCMDGSMQACITAQGGQGNQVCMNQAWGPCMGGNCGPSVAAGQPCTILGQTINTPPNTCGCGDLGGGSVTLYCDNNLTWQCFPEPPPMLCTQGQVNNEPEMLVGYEPQNAMPVSPNGQIKLWINDECPAFIAPMEVLDASTGAIATPGDRMAKAGDGYLWEPALYIAPDTAENGGTPHFPQHIKGDYNNNPGSLCGIFGGAGNVPGMDPPPPGSNISEQFTTEVIWDVASLGKPPGTYIAEFVAHDGDTDRAVGCITIVIQ